MTTRRSATLAMAAILAGSGVAASQQQLFSLTPGLFVRGVGDIDGDGHADLSVHLPNDSVRVISGRTQLVLYTLTPDAPGIDFGLASASVGDIDGDGVPDLVLGAKKSDINGVDSGFVRFVSGADGSTLFTTPGSAAGEHLGVRVAGIGDASGDGIPDVAVTAADYFAFQEHARVFVLSGADGSVLVQCGHVVDDGQFGSSICGPGDVDADGFGDVAVCANLDDAWVFSGRDGTLIRTLPSIAAGGIHLVSPGGDLDADGHADIAVLDQYYWKGIGRVFSGATGQELLYVEQPSFTNAAQSFHCVGDATGDGVPDYILGAMQAELDSQWDGHIRLVSGATGAFVYSFVEFFAINPYEDPSFGAATVVGDIDADGVADFASHGNGSPLVISGRPSHFTQLPFAASVSPPPGLLAGVGSLAPGSDIALWSTKLPASSSAFLVAGWPELGAPFKGSVMVPNPVLVIGPLLTNAAGVLTLHGTSPPGIPPAFPIWFQTWALDAGAPLGWRSTNAVRAQLH